MSRANGKSPPDPLDDLDDVIAELESSNWDDEDADITAEHIIEAVRAGAAAATGGHKAMSKHDAEEVTKTDHGIQTEPPPSKLSPLAIAWLFVRKFPPWGAVIVALAIVVAYVVLKR
jgi:hypothetical protein